MIWWMGAASAARFIRLLPVQPPRRLGDLFAVIHLLSVHP